MDTHGATPFRLARYLALTWCGLIIYGSLHPFSGWRDIGVSPLAFLDAGWPRYWTAFDLLANVAVYLPLGFLLTLAFSHWRWRWLAPLLAVLLGTGLSLGLEIAQNWLPSRVPSHVDFACNIAGTLLGGLWAIWIGPRYIARITQWQSLLAPSAQAELGLTLLGLWLLVPLSPEILLFGAGDLRQALGLPGAVPFAADRFVQIEAAVTALNALAVGLILRHLCVRATVALWVIPLFLLLGLLIRTLSAAVLINPLDALAWLTPGAQLGLVVALAILMAAIWLPSTARLMLAAIVLMAGTVLVNLAPPNPYSTAALAAWRQGHFLNFNGLTRWVATLWPFLTLPFLLLAIRRP